MKEHTIISLAREIQVLLYDPFEVYNDAIVEDFIGYCINNLSEVVEGHYLVARALFQIYYKKSLQSRNPYGKTTVYILAYFALISVIHKYKTVDDSILDSFYSSTNLLYCLLNDVDFTYKPWMQFLLSFCYLTIIDSPIHISFEHELNFHISSLLSLDRLKNDINSQQDIIESKAIIIIKKDLNNFHMASKEGMEELFQYFFSTHVI